MYLNRWVIAPLLGTFLNYNLAHVYKGMEISTKATLITSGEQKIRDAFKILAQRDVVQMDIFSEGR